MGTLPGQLHAFLVMALDGVAIGFSFDLYRALRSLLRPRRAWSDLGDVLFCAGAAVLLAAGWIAANWGAVRGFVPLGLAAGGALYFGLASPTVLPVARRSVHRSARLAAAVARTVLWPVVWTLRLARRAAGRTGRALGARVGHVGRTLTAGRLRAKQGAVHAGSRLRRWPRAVVRRLLGGSGPGRSR